MVRGRCDCGGVRFELPAVRDTVILCHCSQCRRISGHVWASTEAPFDSLTFIAGDSLRWYASSDRATRGFCATCGSSLFYRRNGAAGLAIAAGCLEDTTGMRIGKHIFVADKGDYYPRPEDAPAFDSR
ncbi:GFA family protein [Celeribacter indicus]|uniref:Glutathione-dependent formaldehyde-activating protein n=1 Tax=Celeribacter indicus TaxID=1208324 RepID=A0A0B5E2N9_9RHOB|nr:GFA family protein [Celeribacter indicus]AJE47640.1 glutathione-dependent formaldehyde-activating protein [Celeribacter indicus]SDW12860.1 Uncharacterized conserved protein [Celeribacter indicus]